MTLMDALLGAAPRYWSGTSFARVPGARPRLYVTVPVADFCTASCGSSAPFWANWRPSFVRASSTVIEPDRTFLPSFLRIFLKPLYTSASAKKSAACSGSALKAATGVEGGGLLSADSRETQLGAGFLAGDDAGFFTCAATNSTSSPALFPDPRRGRDRVAPQAGRRAAALGPSCRTGPRCPGGIPRGTAGTGGRASGPGPSAACPSPGARRTAGSGRLAVTGTGRSPTS